MTKIPGPFDTSDLHRLRKIIILYFKVKKKICRTMCYSDVFKKAANYKVAKFVLATQMSPGVATSNPRSWDPELLSSILCYWMELRQIQSFWIPCSLN